MCVCVCVFLEIFNVLTQSYDSCKSHRRRHKWRAVSCCNVKIISVNVTFRFSFHTLMFVTKGPFSSVYTELAFQWVLILHRNTVKRHRMCLTLSSSFAMNFIWHSFPLPHMWPQTHPRFFLLHHLPKHFWKRPSLAVLCSSPKPPSARHHPAALAFCISFFVRDLPPQSHKSTEDRCLLCLIKALPPGVIPQFEQEEKPSEGGNVLDQSYEGPILCTLI